MSDIPDSGTDGATTCCHRVAKASRRYEGLSQSGWDSPAPCADDGKIHAYRQGSAWDVCNLPVELTALGRACQLSLKHPWPA